MWVTVGPVSAQATCPTRADPTGGIASARIHRFPGIITPRMGPGLPNAAWIRRMQAA